MDFNADGILDFVSGSYDPGDLYFFRGLGKGKYAAVEKLRDKYERKLKSKEDQLERAEMAIEKEKAEATSATDIAAITRMAGTGVRKVA